ncbi:hypothetical protein [Cellulomonas alba]|uniref:Uncharacterized protein n=1 Tax=Cellulomonas alba TaxID=3053467 RepID=A0ABT7SDM3_9CELL|nr:hypothetical protein [Cellulomonas alba]MDM7854289.1 hypothetical protein [Cellulomonas alba]
MRLWQAAARDLGEHALALQLDEACPSDLDGRSSWTGRSYDLIQLGRSAQARDELLRAGATPPSGSDLTARDVVLAAACAACGDDGAWHWLLAAAARIDGGAWLAALVGAVADQRGELATADSAWVAARGSGAHGRTARVRAGVAIVASRRRDDPQDVGRLVLDVVGAAIAADLERRPGVAVAIAQGLLERGDVAGARLVLRTTLMLVPSSAEVRAALGAVPARRPVTVVAVATALAAVLIGGLIALTTVVPAPGVRVIGIVAVSLGGALWARRVPLPGMTAAESAVWRDVRGLVWDEQEQRLVPPGNRNGGWYGIAAIAGLAAGTALVAPALAALSALAGSGFAAWADSGSAGFAYLAGAALGTAGGVLLVRWAIRARRRSRARRELSARAQSRAREGASCRCWSDAWLRGWLAEETAAQHLADAQALAVIPGSQVRRCPSTGTLWLVGPLAADGLWLALRGDAPRAAPQPDQQGDGFYL